MTEENFAEGDRIQSHQVLEADRISAENYWAKRAHDSGELSLELRQKFREYLGDQHPRASLKENL